MSYLLQIIPDNEDEPLSEYFKSVSHTKFDSTMQSHMHSHPHTELFYISKGKGILRTQNKDIEISHGDIIIINSNTMHTEKCLENDFFEYYIVELNGVVFNSVSNKTTPPHDVEVLQGAIIDEQDSDNIYILPMQDKETEIQNRFRVIFNEFENKKQFYRTVILNNLSNLVISVVRLLKIVVSLDDSGSFKNQYSNCVLVKQYIDTNFSMQITLDDLASKAFLSKGYLIRSFNKCYGTSPIEYLKKKRIECAKHLLRTTKLSIAQITTNIGFSNQSHFAQAFKEITSMSPKQYRDENQK